MKKDSAYGLFTRLLVLSNGITLCTVQNYTKDGYLTSSPLQDKILKAVLFGCSSLLHL